MTERNPCIEAGCRAACCRNMFLIDSKETIEHAFPNAEYTTLEDLPGKGEAPDGVYYADYERGLMENAVLARLEGRCPNLDKDFNCAIYDSRPHACINFKLGSGPCLDIRSEQRKMLNKKAKGGLLTPFINFLK